ncbi:MAG: hypothetical protein ACI3XQ_11480 [Eubacteriales bacterium]
MALKLSDIGLYEKKESENRVTPVVLPTFEENEAIRKRLESMGLLQSDASDLIAEKNRSALSTGNESGHGGMYKQDGEIGKNITDRRISDIRKQAEQQQMRSAVKAYTEREGNIPDIAPGQSVPTSKAPLPEINQTEKNRGLYFMQNAGAGFLSGATSYAYGIENALADIGTGGKRGEEINRIERYLSENENERNTLFLSASYDEDRAVMKIAESAGVPQETVRAYKKLELPTFERQNAEAWANENDLNTAEKFLLGEAAFQIGQNIPNMVIMKALPLGEPKTLVDTAQKGIQAAYKAGNLNLKTVSKSIADGVVNAVKSLPHEAILMGNTFGNTFFENQKDYGDEKRILENFINSAGNAFVEGFTENLGGFTDIASVAGVLDSRTGSTAMTLVKTLMKAAFNMAEEGAEEVVNVPLSGIVDKLTFEPDKKWFGDDGIFDTSEMIRSGVSGALVGGLMGAFGTVVAVADAVSPATKGVSDNVYAINAFAENMNPADIRAAAETLNRVSEKLGDGTTINAKTATTEDIRNRSAELLDTIRERAEMYKRGETDVTETAQRAENKKTKTNQIDTETERTGRENGANEDSIQTAKNISDAIGIPVRFYTAPGGEGIMENGYYRDGVIYVNAKSDTATAQILSHELTHAIGDSEEYSQLETMILRKMKADGTYETIMRRNQNLYADGKIYGRTAAQIRAEVTAEYVSKNLLTDEQSITSLVHENRSIGQKIRSFLDSILAKLGNKAAKERKFITDARNLYAKALGEKQFAYREDAQYSIDEDVREEKEKNPLDEIEVDENGNVIEKQERRRLSDVVPMMETKGEVDDTGAENTIPNVKRTKPKTMAGYREQQKSAEREKRNVKRQAEMQAFSEEYKENAGIPENMDETVSDDIRNNEDYASVTGELPKNATETERDMYYSLYKEYGDKQRAFNAIKGAAVNRIKDEFGLRRDVTGSVMETMKKEGGNKTADPERQNALDNALSEWENPRLFETETGNGSETGIPGPTDAEEAGVYSALIAEGKTPEEAKRILTQNYEMRRREALNAKTAMRKLGYRISGAVADNYFDAKGIIDANHAAEDIRKRINQYIKQFGIPEEIDTKALAIARGKYKLEETDQKSEFYNHISMLAKMHRDLDTMMMAGIRGSNKSVLNTIKTNLDQIFSDFKWDSIKTKGSKTLELNLSNPENVMTRFFGDTELARELTDTFIKPVIDNSASARRQTNRQMERIMKHKLTKTESALAQIVAEYALDNGEEKPVVTRDMLTALMRGEEGAVEEIISAVSKSDGTELLDELRAKRSEEAVKRVDREIARMRKSLEETTKELNKTTRKSYQEQHNGSPKYDPEGNEYYEVWRESAKQRKNALESAIREKEFERKTLDEQAKDYRKIAKAERIRKANDEEAYVSLRSTLQSIASNAVLNAKKKKNYSVDAVIRKAEAAAKDYRDMLNDLYDAINEVSVIHGRGEIRFRKNYMPHRQPEKAMNAWEQIMKTAGFDEVTDLPASIAGLTADFRPFRKWLSFAQRRMGTETVYDAAANMERYLYAANEAIYHIDDIMKLRTLESYIRDKFDKASQDRRADMLDDLTDTGEDAISINEKDRQLREASQDYGPLVTWLKNYTDDLAGKQILSRDQENTIGRTTLRKAGALIRWSNRTMMTFNVASSLRQLSQIPNVIAETGKHAFSAPMLVFNPNNDLEQRYRISEKSTFLAEKTKMQRTTYEKDIAASGSERIVKAADIAVDLAEKTWEQTDIFMSKFAVYSFFQQGIDNGMNEAEAMRYADSKARSILASRLRGASPLVFRSKNVIIQLMTLFQRETLAQWENISKTLPEEWKRIEQTKGKKAAAETIAKFAASQAAAAWIANNIFSALGLGTVSMFDILGLLFGNFITGASGVLNGILVNVIKKFVRDRDEDEENDMTLLEAIVAGAKSYGKTVSEFIDDVPFGSSILAAARAFGADVDSRLPVNLPSVSNAIKAGGDISAIDSLAKDKRKETDPEMIAQIEAAQKDEEAQLFYHLMQQALDIMSVTVTGGNQLRKTLNGVLSILQAGDYTDGYKQGQLKYTVTGADTVRALLFGKSGTLSQQKWVNQNFDTLKKKQTEAYQALTDAGVKPSTAYEIAVGISDVEKRENETLAIAQAAYIDGLTELDDEQKAELYYEYVATDRQKNTVDSAVEAGADYAEAVNTVRNIREADRNFEKIDLLLATDMDADAMRAVYEGMIATKETDDDGNFIGYTDDDKVNAILGYGMTYKEFLKIRSENARLNADDSITAAQRSTRFLAWLSEMGYSDDRIMQIGDTFPFATGFTVDPKTYKKLIANGLDAQSAVAVTDALMGAKSSADKIAAIWETTLSGKTLDTAIKTVLTDGAYERYHTAIDAGVDVDIYLWVLNNADTNQDGYISNEERESAINRLLLGKGQASALWIATGGSQSSNPYKAQKISKSSFSVPSIGIGSIGLKKIGI